jgi:mRNA interferase MazF
MIGMPSFSKPEIVLVRYPFSDLTGTKVRPAVVVSASHVSQDLLIGELRLWLDCRLEHDLVRTQST